MGSKNIPLSRKPRGESGNRTPKCQIDEDKKVNIEVKCSEGGGAARFGTVGKKIPCETSLKPQNGARNKKQQRCNNVCRVFKCLK